MALVRFPKTREDGSFVVVARFALNTDSNVITFASKVAEWSRLWTERSRYMEHRDSKNWEGGGVTQHDFFDYFADAPTILNIDSSELAVRFTGKQYNYYCRDWLVKFAADLIREMQGVTKLVRFENL